VGYITNCFIATRDLNVFWQDLLECFLIVKVFITKSDFLLRIVDSLFFSVSKKIWVERKQILHEKKFMKGFPFDAFASRYFSKTKHLVTKLLLKL
jgi:hypothetical protein